MFYNNVILNGYALYVDGVAYKKIASIKGICLDERWNPSRCPFYAFTLRHMDFHIDRPCGF